MKKLLRTVLIALGLGALAFFIWDGWGANGNISGFFIMLWDWFYAITHGASQAAHQAIG